MDQAGIQKKVAYGYRKAAQYLGAPFALYRPEDPLDPLGNRIGTRMADFDLNPAFTYAAPAKYATPAYYGLFDPTDVLPGDYLVADQGTWFVAGMAPNRPTLCVICNRTLSFARPGLSTPSRSMYGGDIRGDEVPLLSGWPASELQGTKGERGATGLPGDPRMPWSIILLPSMAEMPIKAADRCYDDLGRSWTISSVELSALGWRLTAALTET